jgi:Cu/Ag efflux protein CusF
MRKMMLAASLFAVVVVAQPSASLAQTLVEGQVTKIDPPAEKITIRHGPIKKFDMDDGMTMVFRVADPAMLTVVKVGDKVRFDVERVNGQFTVTKLEKAK